MMDYSEIIEVSDIKVSIYSELNEYMEIYMTQGWRWPLCRVTPNDTGSQVSDTGSMVLWRLLSFYICSLCHWIFVWFIPGTLKCRSILIIDVNVGIYYFDLKESCTRLKNSIRNELKFCSEQKIYANYYIHVYIFFSLQSNNCHSHRLQTLFIYTSLGSNLIIFSSFRFFEFSLSKMTAWGLMICACSAIYITP